MFHSNLFDHLELRLFDAHEATETYADQKGKIFHLPMNQFPGEVYMNLSLHKRLIFKMKKGNSVLLDCVCL